MEIRETVNIACPVLDGDSELIDANDSRIRYELVGSHFIAMEIWGLSDLVLS